MNLILALIDFIIHIDQHLNGIINHFSIWTYLILFLIIFVETGLVIFPFLPGDSLLFAACALSALSTSFLHLGFLILTFLLAAIIGDTVNYEIGKKVGLSIPEKSLLGRVLNKEKMNKAEAFFDTHGGKTIIIARFMPFIRTFAPFIAGASNMKYKQFALYNIIGGTLWVLICSLAGYFFGNIPFVRENFSVVVLGIIGVSLIPMIVTFLKNHFAQNKTV